MPKSLLIFSMGINSVGFITPLFTPGVAFVFQEDTGGHFGDVLFLTILDLTLHLKAQLSEYCFKKF